MPISTDLNELLAKYLREVDRFQAESLISPARIDPPVEHPIWMINPRYGTGLLDQGRMITPPLAAEAVIGVGVFEGALVRVVCYRGRGVSDLRRFGDLEPGFWRVSDHEQTRLSPAEVCSLACGHPPWKLGLTTARLALDVHEHLRVLGPVAFAEVFGYEPPNLLTVAGPTVPSADPKPCPNCNDTGVLAGYGFGVSINACDRPCPCGAKPEIEQAPKDEGPSEWTIVRREARPSTDGSYSAEHVTVQVGKQIAVFRVVAHRDPDYYETTVIQQQPNPTPWGQRVLVVRHEACVDMAIARLLCGLRDGTVQP
jgi:hypothetical protein